MMDDLYMYIYTQLAKDHSDDPDGRESSIKVAVPSTAISPLIGKAGAGKMRWMECLSVCLNVVGCLPSFLSIDASPHVSYYYSMMDGWMDV